MMIVVCVGKWRYGCVYRGVSLVGRSGSSSGGHVLLGTEL